MTIGNTPPDSSNELPADAVAEQEAQPPRRRDILRDLAWFELTKCMDDQGPSHLSTDRAAEILFGTPREELRGDS